MTPIVFDLDGTLIDSANDLADSVNHTLREFNMKERELEEVKSFIGDGVRLLIERALGKNHSTLVSTAQAFFTSHYFENCTNKTVLYPRVKETLLALKDKGHPLALLTNKPYDFSIKILKELEILDLFACIIGGDSIGVRKPNPLTLEHIAQSLQVQSSSLIMVGDHIADIEVAKACDAKIVYCEYGIGRKDNLPIDSSIQHFDELLKVISELKE